MIGSWDMLQLVDVSYNNFVSKVSGALLRTWKAMIHVKDDADQKFTLYDTSDMI